MRIVLSGGEKGTYRVVLLDNEVQNIGLNITQFAVPKTKEVNLKELLGGANVYVYSSDEDEDVAKYDEFVRKHLDDITCVIGRPDYDGGWLGDKYVPLWNDAKDMERLAYLCEKYGRVAISDKAINSTTAPRIKQLQQRWGCTLVGLTSKVDTIVAFPWDVVLVSSWTSVVRFGETQVWDGHGLRRYPAQKKESARKKHRPDIVRLGVDFDAVMEDDVKEVAKLAVRSWKAWEEYTYGVVTPAAYHPFGDEDDDESELLSNDEIATISPENHNGVNPVSGGTSIATVEVERRHESDRKLLPVIGFETIQEEAPSSSGETAKNGEIGPNQESVVRFKSSGVRQCDSCYLAPRCPEFKEHAECAYDLPVEVRSKSQLRAVMNAMIEMQASRVMFAKFAEDTEGQGMDPVLSSEMDRFFRLVKDAKEIEDTRDLVRFEMEAKTGAGVLSRIFGNHAAEKLNEVETPMTTGELDQAIIDADVLD